MPKKSKRPSPKRASRAKKAKRIGPSRKDRVMGYLSDKLMDRGYIRPKVFLDERTWQYGKPYPYGKPPPKAKSPKSEQKQPHPRRHDDKVMHVPESVWAQMDW